jgi:hypothetical protein
MSEATLEVTTAQQPATRVPTLVLEDRKEIDETALPLIKQASAIAEIKSNEDFAAADDLVGKLNKARKGVTALVEKFFKKHKENAKKAHQDLCDDERDYIAMHDAPLAAAREALLGKMGAYTTWLEAENRRLQQEAADRQKKDQDVIDRQEIDAALQSVAHLGYTIEIVNDGGPLGMIKTVTVTNKRGEVRQMHKGGFLEVVRTALAKEADDKRIAKIEEDRLAQAAKLEADGKPEEADKVLDAPIPPPSPVQPPAPVFVPPPTRVAYTPTLTIPTSSSVGKRKNWTWELEGETEEAKLESFHKLVKAAAENPAYLAYLTTKDKALDGLAKSGESQARAPGIRFFNDPITANKRSA